VQAWGLNLQGKPSASSLTRLIDALHAVQAEEFYFVPTVKKCGSRSSTSNLYLFRKRIHNVPRSPYQIYSLQSGSYLQLHLSDRRTHTAGHPSSMKEDQFWHLRKMSRDWSARNCAAKHKVVSVYPVVLIASSLEVNLALCPCQNSLVHLEVDAATAKNSEDLNKFSRFAFSCSIPSVAMRSRNIDWLYNFYSYTQ